MVIVYIVFISIIIILLYIVFRLRRENKALINALQQKEYLLNQRHVLIGQLANAVRQSVSPLLGFIDILKDGKATADEQVVMNKNVEENLKILFCIIDDMNELSFYATTESLPLDMDVIPAYSCRHLCDLYQEQCPEGVDIVFDCKVSEDVICHTNMEALKVVTQHLIENAIKQTERGTITLAAEDAGDTVRFSIADNSPGIPADIQPHIFEIEYATTEQMRKAGMGIVICHTILQRLGGSIWLDTNYHDGTRFVFEVPK